MWTHYDNFSMNDTICAIATPPGTGGIAILRISGLLAPYIAQQLTGQPLTLRVHYRTVNGLDDVVVTSFHAPHSYTGEEVVEIACHGSNYIQQELLRRCIDLGARMAQPGEFTQRAFLNGKMDLSQAEAVADLIAAESKAAHQMALHQLKGGISRSLLTLREQLLHFTSLIELELDFADHEDLEFADRQQLRQLAQTILQHLAQLKDSFRLGNAIKHGIPVAIIGATNAGKSTLLNALAGEQRAIVSDINGTTRDTIEVTATINGVLFRFIDTAGLRETQDPIEQMGINRSRQAALNAEVVLHIIDATQPQEPHAIRTLIQTLQHQTLVTVYNKSDLINQSDESTDKNTLFISAKNEEIAPLLRWLQDHYSASIMNDNLLISNERHYNALLRAYEAILRVQDGLDQQLSGEILSLDLQDCLKALGEITGQISSEEVLHTVFSHFCIGK